MSIGRKPILNYKLIKVICEMTESGMFDKHIAESIGVSEVTWHNWKRAGKAIQQRTIDDISYKPTEREQLYLDFYNSLSKAYATAEIKAIEQIKDASKKDWKAAAWFLERRYKGNWSKLAKATETTPEHLQRFLNERGIKQ